MKTKREIKFFEKDTVNLEKIKGGKRLINTECCQGGKTVDFYAHSFLGFEWVTNEVTGTKDNCA